MSEGIERVGLTLNLDIHNPRNEKAYFNCRSISILSRELVVFALVLDIYVYLIYQLTRHPEAILTYKQKNKTRVIHMD